MRVIRILLIKLPFTLLFTVVVAYATLFAVSKVTQIHNPVASSLINQPVEIPLTGTGSMYPTLYWDINQEGPEDYEKALQENRERVLPKLYPYLNLAFKGYSFENPKIGEGDIISFAVDQDKDTYYIKRAIGLPGDKIEFRDGYVIRNGQTLKEPYTNKPRSTFGGSFIKECAVITIPNGRILALGDNRKVSLDSRSDLGYVNISKIDFVLPFNKQDNLKSKWRVISTNELASERTTLDINELLAGINNLRKKSGLNELSIHHLLDASADLRANEILDLGEDLTKQEGVGTHFVEAMKKVGYENVLTAEYVIQGYYEADELLSLRSESEELKSVLFEQDYDDIGISVQKEEVNGCPTQVIVLHFGGYLPATYSDKDHEHWSNNLVKLQESARTWKSARGNDIYNQDDLENLLRKYEKAIAISQNILYKIDNSLWLSDSDRNSITEYSNLVVEINNLSSKLNNQAEQNVLKTKQKNYEQCLTNWKLYVEKRNDCKKYLE